MKPISSVIIFLLLVCSASMGWLDSYHCAETAIVQDMNQALSNTCWKREGVDYARYHTKLSAIFTDADLRRRSFVSYALGEDGHSLRSRQMRLLSRWPFAFYFRAMLIVPSLRYGIIRPASTALIPIVIIGLDGYIYRVFSSSSRRQIGAG